MPLLLLIFFLYECFVGKSHVSNFILFYLRKRLVIFLFEKPEIWVNKVPVLKLKTAVGSSSPDAPGHSSLTNLGEKKLPKVARDS